MHRFTLTRRGGTRGGQHSNTTKYDPSGNAQHAWRYAYDDSGRLVGTSDAMGCGVNYHYDAGGRLIGSDYSPCKSNQPPYSGDLDFSTGDDFETFYRYDSPDPMASSVVDATGVALSIDATWLPGRLVSTKTRGAMSVFSYDGLGRTIGTAKRIARPGATSPTVSDRYAPRWYVRQTTYDDVDRPTRVTTGAPLLGLLASDGTSELRLSYTRRGLVRSTASSYGSLVGSETRDARGLLKTAVYGDLAQTRRSYTYNVRTQVRDVQTYRTPTDLWTDDPGTGPYVPPPVTGPNTTQVLLEDYAFTYDVMGNLTVAQDLRTLEEWPDTAKPVQRTFAYDSYSRLKQATYAYAAGSAWQSPFEAENTTSTRLPQPSPHLSFANRVYEETFRYDWLNNLVENADDVNAFYDRSLGTSTFADTSAPHRLTSASNRATSSPNSGDLAAAYDDAGQVTALIVKREGNCLPSGASCSQRFAYEWDEVGNLVHAARWDLTSDERTNNGTLATNPPARAPDADLSYTYDGKSRVVKTAAPPQGDPHYTAYVFSTLELRSTEYTGTGEDADYTLSTDTTQVRLGAGSVSARVVVDPNMPRVSASQQHLLLQFGDHLGSTSFTIDHATSELVQYSTYTSYGTAESDYRPSRWSSFREPYRFTGKEDDVEVGLNYHGARYYSPALRRWMSPDPVTIHSAGSDINPYAYGYGNPTAYVDPDGRNPLLIAAVIGAVISTAVYVYHNGFEPSSGSWWAGAGLAAGSGAMAGLTGGAVGVGLGAALGAGAGTFGGALLIGAASGMAGSAAGYVTSYGTAVVANEFGANFNTSGYSPGGVLQTMAVGALTGAAMGGGIWGAQKAIGVLSSASSSAGNGPAGSGGPAGAEGQTGRAAEEASAELAKAPTATQAAQGMKPAAAPVAAPKATPARVPNRVPAAAATPKAEVVQMPEEVISEPSYRGNEPPQWNSHEPELRQAWQGENRGWSAASKAVPDRAISTLSKIDITKQAPEGFKGGRVFQNDARGGGQALPQTGPGGEPITYREWDVNKYVPGTNRGAERLVTGSDGSAYYTDNHYRTFQRIR